MDHPTSLPLRLDERAIIGRVRLRASGTLDQASARHRLQSALEAVSLQPAGLPASALLCIRSLGDPMPRQLSLNWSATPPFLWANAINAQIERAARNAARPIEGTVPAAHGAVLFRDRAELLACLALDWMRGEIDAHWWWRYLLRATATARVAPAQWVAEARYVPAAANLLAEREALVAFAAALEPEEAQQIVAHLYAAFGVEPSLSREPAQNATPIEPARTDQPLVTSAWVRWVPEVSARRVKSGPARAFVAVSLALARAPSAVRSPELLSSIEGWLAQDDNHRSVVFKAQAPRSEASEGEVRVQAGKDRQITANEEALSVAPSRAPSVGPADDAALPAGSDAQLRAPRAEVRQDASTTFDSPLDTRASHAGTTIAGSAIEQEPRQAKLHVAAHPSVALGRASEAPPAFPTKPNSEAVARLARPTANGTAIATAHGGAFFLLNVLLVLELYGDFTKPRSRALEPSPWTLMARLARAVLGDEAQPDDTLWWILRDLAGTPTNDDRWPPEFRANPDWLIPFPERHGWTWSVNAGRLCVEHPRGFVVLDVPVEEDAGAQRAREWAQYGVIEVTEAPGRFSQVEWPERLALFVRARIHAAVQAKDADASVRLSLVLRARVRATDAHVDVFMALSDLPIEVRLAGLDRDPGWVPAAGRFVAFHFE